MPQAPLRRGFFCARGQPRTEPLTDNTAAPAEAEAPSAEEIWAELDAAEGVAPSTMVAVEGDDGSTADFADEAADEPQGGTEDTGAAPAEAGNEPPAAAADDRWASLPEDARSELARLTAENAALEQKNRSAVGRAGAFQRRYEDLVKAAQPREVAGDRPTPSAAIASIKEDYPEIAAPLEKAFGAIEGSVAQLAEAEEGRRKAAETELTAYLDEQEAALKQAHPDSFDVVKANAPAFRSWIQDQPLALREAFARNAEAITDAAGAAAVIGAFKAFIAPPAEAPAVPAKAQLSDKRQRQLGAGTAPSLAARRPTISGIPEEGDPQAIWDAIEAQEQAKAATARR